MPGGSVGGRQVRWLGTGIWASDSMRETISSVFADLVERSGRTKVLIDAVQFGMNADDLDVDFRDTKITPRLNKAGLEKIALIVPADFPPVGAPQHRRDRPTSRRPSSPPDPTPEPGSNPEATREPRRKPTCSTSKSPPGSTNRLLRRRSRSRTRGTLLRLRRRDSSDRRRSTRGRIIPNRRSQRGRRPEGPKNSGMPVRLVLLRPLRLRRRGTTPRIYPGPTS